MLQTIDVLIGFTVVMLILSVIVTFLVQFIVTSLLNLKGRVLKGGVAQLLLTLDKNGLNPGEAMRIADHILRNALIGKKRLFTEKRGLANTVHREELISLVLDFAAAADLHKADALAQGKPCNNKQGQPLDKNSDEHLRARLLNSLRANGIADSPKDILRAVRGTMLELERSQPELANHARHSLALLTHASSEYVAKINAWFDQTIDRSIESFTTRARIWTIAISAVVALFFQVNSFDLIKRLSVDDTTRQALVTMALSNPDKFADLAKPDTEQVTAPANGTAAAPATLQNAVATAPSPADIPGSGQGQQAATITAIDALQRIKADPDLGQLVNADLIAWPRDWTSWAQYWLRAPNVYEFLVRVIGVLLTIALLGLGAPVWYEVLKNLIQLRSVVARKDDAQRLTRQTSQEDGAASPPSTGRTASVVAAPFGERGDLGAVG